MYAILDFLLHILNCFMQRIRTFRANNVFFFHYDDLKKKKTQKKKIEQFLRVI